MDGFPRHPIHVRSTMNGMYSTYVMLDAEADAYYMGEALVVEDWEGMCDM